jgi:GTPase involved in cell partitioning and DNA repair
MKFVDSANVRVEAGNGGAGSLMVDLMEVMVVMAGVYFSEVKKV